jgi:outer membrane protein TolC
MQNDGKWKCLASAVASLLALLAPAASADTAAPQTDEPVALTAAECVALALEYHPDLEAARNRAGIAKASYLESLAAYDPLLSGFVNGERFESRQTTTLLSNSGTVQADRVTYDGHRRDHGLRISGLLPYGLEYDLQLSRGFDDDSFGDNDGWARSVSLRQPLLRGAWGADRLPIKSARALCAAADARLEFDIVRTAQEVLEAYWHCVAAAGNLRVEEAGLSSAQQHLRDNETRLRIGAGSGKEVDESLANVAARESAVIGARANYADAQDSLRRAMGLSPQDPWGRVTIVPAQQPANEDHPLDEAASTAAALRSRPELRLNEFELDSLRYRLRAARNERLPRLDLVLRYEDYGSGGHRHSADSISFFDSRDSCTTAGLEASIPLLNLGARAAARRAGLEVATAEEEQTRIEQLVRWEVRLAVRDVMQYREQAAKFEEAAEILRGNVASEVKLLNAGGNASNYTVLQKQQELTRAEVEVVQARVNHERALVRLWVAEGSLLQHLGLRDGNADPDGGDSR